MREARRCASRRRPRPPMRRPVLDDVRVRRRRRAVEASIVQRQRRRRARTRRRAELTKPGNQTRQVGHARRPALSATDPNGDPLPGASGLPPGLASTRRPAASAARRRAAGTFNVVVAVSDGFNSASATFTWTVNEPAPPLVLNPPPPPRRRRAAARSPSPPAPPAAERARTAGTSTTARRSRVVAHPAITHVFTRRASTT